MFCWKCNAKSVLLPIYNSRSSRKDASELEAKPEAAKSDAESETKSEEEAKSEAEQDA